MFFLWSFVAIFFCSTCSPVEVTCTNKVLNKESVGFGSTHPQTLHSALVGGNVAVAIGLLLGLQSDGVHDVGPTGSFFWSGPDGKWQLLLDGDPVALIRESFTLGLVVCPVGSTARSAFWTLYDPSPPDSKAIGTRFCQLAVQFNQPSFSKEGCEYFGILGNVSSNNMRDPLNSGELPLRFLLITCHSGELSPVNRTLSMLSMHLYNPQLRLRQELSIEEVNFPSWSIALCVLYILTTGWYTARFFSWSRRTANQYHFLILLIGLSKTLGNAFVLTFYGILMSQGRKTAIPQIFFGFLAVFSSNLLYVLIFSIARGELMIDDRLQVRFGRGKLIYLAGVITFALVDNFCFVLAILEGYSGVTFYAVCCLISLYYVSVFSRFCKSVIIRHLMVVSQCFIPETTPLWKSKMLFGMIPYLVGMWVCMKLLGLLVLDAFSLKSPATLYGLTETVDFFLFLTFAVTFRGQQHTPYFYRVFSNEMQEPARPSQVISWEPGMPLPPYPWRRHSTTHAQTTSSSMDGDTDDDGPVAHRKYVWVLHPTSRAGQTCIQIGASDDSDLPRGQLTPDGP